MLLSFECLHYGQQPYSESGHSIYGDSLLLLWRRSGLVVSALDFRSGGRWFEPGHCRCVVSLDKKLYSTLSLFTQVYKRVPAIIMPGGNLAMD